MHVWGGLQNPQNSGLLLCSLVPRLSLGTRVIPTDMELICGFTCSGLIKKELVVAFLSGRSVFAAGKKVSAMLAFLFLLESWKGVKNPEKSSTLALKQ